MKNRNGIYFIYQDTKSGEYFLSPNKDVLRLELEFFGLKNGLNELAAHFNIVGEIHTRNMFRIRMYGFKNWRELVRDAVQDAIIDILE